MVPPEHFRPAVELKPHPTVPVPRDEISWYFAPCWLLRQKIGSMQLWGPEKFFFLLYTNSWWINHVRSHTSQLIQKKPRLNCGSKKNRITFGWFFQRPSWSHLNRTDPFEWHSSEVAVSLLTLPSRVRILAHPKFSDVWKIELSDLRESSAKTVDGTLTRKTMRLP